LLVRATFGTSPELADVRETAAAFEAIRIEELLDIVPSILDHDVIDFLSGWDLPSSVIVGSRDPLTPPRESRLLAERLSDATLEIVPGAGHQLMLERPDEVNSMLRHLVARAGVIRR
jgi:pimeloyl-ACP methyl ester carboxylesterase